MEAVFTTDILGAALERSRMREDVLGRARGRQDVEGLTLRL